MASMSGRSSRSTLTGMKALLRMLATSGERKDSRSITWHPPAALAHSSCSPAVVAEFHEAMGWDEEERIRTVAGRISNADEEQPVQSLGQGDCLRLPHLPCHGIVGMLPHLDESALSVRYSASTMRSIPFSRQTAIRRNEWTIKQKPAPSDGRKSPSQITSSVQKCENRTTPATQIMLVRSWTHIRAPAFAQPIPQACNRRLRAAVTSAAAARHRARASNRAAPGPTERQRTIGGVASRSWRGRKATVMSANQRCRGC